MENNGTGLLRQAGDTQDVNINIPLPQSSTFGEAATNKDISDFASSAAEGLLDTVLNPSSFASNPVRRGKNYAFDTTPTGYNLERYYNIPRVYKEIGFSPWRDNESLYNAKSTWFEDWARSAAYAKRLSGLGFDSMLPWNAWTGDATDGESAKKYMEYNLIGSSGKTGVGGFFNNLTLNAGYTVGIGAEFALEELVTWGATTVAALPTGGASWAAASANLTRQLANVKKALNVMDYAKDLAKMSKKLESLKDINTLKGVFNTARLEKAGKRTLDVLTPNTYKYFSNILKTTSKSSGLSKTAKMSKGFGAFYRDVREVLAATSESRLEGGMVELDVINELRDDIYNKTGRDPNEQEWAEINAIAAARGKETFWYNIPALWVSNKIVFEKSFKGMPLMSDVRKGIYTSPGKKLVYDATKQAGQQFGLKKTGWRQSIVSLTEKATYNPKNLTKNLARNFIKYTGANITEGFQETYQESISAAFKERGKNIYENPLYAELNSVWDDILPQLKFYTSSKEGADIFLSGFLMGGLVQGPQTLVYQKIPTKLLELKDGAHTEKAKTDQAKRDLKLVDAFNKITENKSYLFDVLTKHATNQKIIDQAEVAAIENQDERLAMDLRDEGIGDHLVHILQSGKSELLLEYLNDLKGLNAEELQQAFGEEENAQDYYHKKINRMVEGVKHLEKVSKTIDDIVGENPFRPWQLSKSASPEAVMQEWVGYTTHQEVKSLALKYHYSFQRTAQRMGSVFESFKQENLGNNITGSDFAVLFDAVQRVNSKGESTSPLLAELEVLKTEYETYSKGGPEEKKRAEYIKQKMDLLKKFDEATQVYTQADAIMTEQALSEGFKSKEDYRKAQVGASVVPGAVVKLKNGKELKVVSTTPKYFYVEGESKRYSKSSVVTSSTYSKDLDIALEAEKELFDVYKEYVTLIAQIKNSNVLNAAVLKSFTKLKDFYVLKQDHANLSEAINYILDPEQFKNIANRLTEVAKTDKENKREGFKKGVQARTEKTYLNDLLQSVSELGVYFDVEEISKLEKGEIPKFYDSVTHEPVQPGTDKYNKVIDLFEKYEEVAKVKFEGKYAIEEGQGYELDKLRKRIENDSRTYNELASYFGIDPKALESSVNLAEVLDKVEKSKYATKAEKILARRLKAIVSKEANIKFRKNHNKAGTFDKSNGIIIDLRHSAYDYRNQKYPAEYLILRQAVEYLISSESEKDGKFKQSLEKVFDRIKDEYKTRQVGKDRYIESLESFVSAALTSQAFQERLAQISFNTSGKNLWEDFISVVKDFLKSILTTVTPPSESVLDEVVGIVSRQFEKTTPEEITPTTSDAPVPDNVFEVLEDLKMGPPKPHKGAYTPDMSIYDMPLDLVSELVREFKRIHPEHESKEATMIVIRNDFDNFVENSPEAVAIIRKYNEVKNLVKPTQEISSEQEDNLIEQGKTVAEINNLTEKEISAEPEIEIEGLTRSQILDDLQHQIDEASTPEELQEVQDRFFDDISLYMAFDINGDHLKAMIEAKEGTTKKSLKLSMLTPNKFLYLRDETEHRKHGVLRIKKVSGNKVYTSPINNGKLTIELVFENDQQLQDKVKYIMDKTTKPVEETKTSPEEVSRIADTTETVIDVTSADNISSQLEAAKDKSTDDLLGNLLNNVQNKNCK